MIIIGLIQEHASGSITVRVSLFCFGNRDQTFLDDMPLTEISFLVIELL